MKPMTSKPSVRLLAIALAAAFAAGCATQPRPLQGEFAQITPR